MSRLLTLDGYRGVAALAVVAWHEGEWFGVLVPTSGYLAVDLFFVLSGYVMAGAYERRWRDGMSAMEFVKVRFVRLYPLYMVGTCVGCLSLLASMASHGYITEFHLDFWKSLPFAVAFLPSPSFGGMGNIYPLNVPAWSLHFELVVNLLYVLAFRVLSIRVLIVVMAMAGGVILMDPAVLYGGFSHSTYWHGLTRVLYSFPAGVLLYRVREMFPMAARPAGGLMAVWPASALLVGAVTSALWVKQGIWSAVVVLAVFPVLVALGTLVEPSGRTARLFAVLGGASYALYAVHFPIIGIVNAVFQKMNIHPPSVVSGLAFLMVILPLCIGLDRLLDPRLRRMLRPAIDRLFPVEGASIAGAR